MMKNFALVSFFALLSAILIYTFFFATGGRADLQYPVEEAAVCKEGLTQHCMVGNCSGLSACRNGRWTACRWEMVCEPGSRASCIEGGCVKGYKECDECGTSYGPCK